MAKVKFQRHKDIGAADAREDLRFLEDCFVDTGAIDVLLNVRDPKCVVLGRTGSGKTALLEQLRMRSEKVIVIEPESLSLPYIENSTLIRFLVDLGVNMEPFYKLLWRHIFVVEIIRYRYGIVNDNINRTIIDRLLNRIGRNKTKQEALHYFFEYGRAFWKETDTRVQGVVSKFEENLEKSLTYSINGKLVKRIVNGEISVRQGTANSLSEELRIEVQQRAQKVVEHVQIQKLTAMMDLLEEDILDDSQKQYYITIDRLDEGWVNDLLRYRLIRSLLETAREFNYKISNMKIIVAIREDLLNRVFRHTRSPGYQEEKYRSMYLSLNWNQEQLEELILKRVQKLIDGNDIDQISLRIEDVVPEYLKVKGSRIKTLQYVFERTLLRPRDVIVFFNECIKKVRLDGKITSNIIFSAEESYSNLRLRALSDEWSADYRTLYQATLLLKGFPADFNVDFLCKQLQEQDALISYWVDNDKIDCRLYEAIDKLMELEPPNFNSIAFELLKVLFEVGVIGIHLPTKRVGWCYLGENFPSKEKFPFASFRIHSAFWKVLEIIT